MKELRLEAPSTPELDRRRAALPQAAVLQRFVDWLSEAGFTIAARHEHTDACYRTNIGGRYLICETDVEEIYEPWERIFERFFGLDRKILDAEQDALLAYQRALNEMAKIENALRGST